MDRLILTLQIIYVVSVIGSLVFTYFEAKKIGCTNRQYIYDAAWCFFPFLNSVYVIYHCILYISVEISKTEMWETFNKWLDKQL